VNWHHFFILFCLVTYSLVSTNKETTRHPAAEDVTQYGWKVTFEDEFSGKDQSTARGTPASCFDVPPNVYLMVGAKKIVDLSTMRI
jgi:hypothetical protein